MCNDITLKGNSHEKVLGVTINNKLSFDEHIIKKDKKAANKTSTHSVE